MPTDSPLSSSASFVSQDRRSAAIALASALVLGTVSQALFWETSLGLNFFLWTTIVVGANVAAFHRGRIRPIAWGAMTAALFLGFSVVRFESVWALVLAVPSTMAILSVLPMLLRDGLDLEGLAKVPWRMLKLITWLPRASIAIRRLFGIAAGESARGHVGRVTTGIAIGAPLAAIFAGLFSADAAFSDAVGVIRSKVGDATSFATCALLMSSGLLFMRTMHQLEGAPWAYVVQRLPSFGPYRYGTANGEADVEGQAASPVAKPLLSTSTWALVIGQVALVFALFVGANLRTLFGGHAVVRAADGPTYASYLHAGFSQFLFATVLSVCLVLGGHALLRVRDARAGTSVPGGFLLASLEAALLVLTGVSLLSCWQRLGIYEDAYGASQLRLGVALVELAILALLVLTLAKVVFRGWRGYGGAVLVLGTLMMVLATGINADEYVARTNLDRAARGATLDVDYLASLSPDARDVMEHPVVLRDPALQTRLAFRYCWATRTADIRARRGLGGCRVVP